jgi:hypothetical protein
MALYILTFLLRLVACYGLSLISEPKLVKLEDHDELEK